MRNTDRARLAGGGQEEEEDEGADQEGERPGQRRLFAAFTIVFVVVVVVVVVVIVVVVVVVVAVVAVVVAVVVVVVIAVAAIVVVGIEAFSPPSSCTHPRLGLASMTDQQTPLETVASYAPGRDAERQTAQRDNVPFSPQRGVAPATTLYTIAPSM